MVGDSLLERLASAVGTKMTLDEGRMVRALWTHNFDSGKNPTAGVFMYEALKAVKAWSSVDAQTLFLGNLKRPTNWLSARQRMRSDCRGFDLVHAQFGSACALVSAATERPYLISIRGSDWAVAAAHSFGGRAHSQLAVAMTRLSLRSASGAVVVSNRLANEVSRYRPDLPILVAPDPIDRGRFKPLNRKEARVELGLDPCAKYILFTTVDPENAVKRPALARAAVSRAKDRIANLHLICASGIPYDSMPRIVAACDLVLSTSISEGWPNCIKEGLACEVPFVSTDVSDLSDIAALDSRCQVVADDPVSLGDAIVKSLKTASPGDGLSDHLKSMDPRHYADSLSKFYAEILWGS